MLNGIKEGGPIASVYKQETKNSLTCFMVNFYVTCFCDLAVFQWLWGWFDCRWQSEGRGTNHSRPTAQFDAKCAYIEGADSALACNPSERSIGILWKWKEHVFGDVMQVRNAWILELKINSIHFRYSFAINMWLNLNRWSEIKAQGIF